ncbi:PepSY-associated TM helix domain-containing protein [Saccharicrinis carchari]|uniref:PepSY-associated TM helix domain-containing protein n=1 Tax=Saccharicrinis carchari TaxID=1168039 RepID=UPI00163DA051|nr:PepSY-associated TM helix domain-containing protein [Saccharicrinis carchari]
MNKNKIRWIKRFKVWHKWPAIVMSFLALLFAASGIVMNHRTVFASINVSRKLLPADYTYRNWNLDAIKGSLFLSEDSVFIYGKGGVYHSNEDFDTFSAFNEGFEKGIDNRSVVAMQYTPRAGLVAGTLNGIFRYDNPTGWNKVNLPVKNQRITDVALKGDTLLVLTRDLLLTSTDLKYFDTHQLPAPSTYKKETTWFKFLWNLHSGELFGLAGKLFVDLLGILVIILSITGLIHFFYPKFIKKEKRKSTKYRSVKATNLRWHNVLGYLGVVFVLSNALTGMFLRPPLLIAIANAKIGIIPYTHLDNINPWHDKLRKLTWNTKMQRYVFSTSEGFYLADELLNYMAAPKVAQPPVSVMGCNALQQVDEDEYLVGSFSGLFSWKLSTGAIYNLGAGEPWHNQAKTGRPISDHMVSGLLYQDNANIWYSDYNRGVVPVSGNRPFLAMPTLVEDTPMSLWNVCLEIHTGRIFEWLLGPFYILYVPLSGLSMLVVLVSGFFLWYWIHRGKPKRKT